MALKTDSLLVGAFFTAALLVLTGFVFILGDFSLQEDYKVFVIFRQINGLQTGSFAEYLGVRVGTVKNIYLREAETEIPNSEVVVVLSIDKKFKIPRNVDIFIDTTGLLGEKYVSIRGAGIGKEFIQNEDSIRGRDPLLLVDAYEKFETSLDKFSDLMNEINQLVSDVEFKDRIRKTADNLAVVSENLNGVITEAQKQLDKTMNNLNTFLTRADGTLKSNQSEIGQSLKNLQEISKRFALFLAQLDFPVKEGDKSKFAEDLLSISGRLDVILRETEKLAVNDKLKSAITETAENLKSATGKVNQFLGQDLGLKNRWNCSVFQSPSDGDYQTDIGWRLSAGRNNLEAGISDINSRREPGFLIGRKENGYTRLLGYADGGPSLKLETLIFDLDWELSLVSDRDWLYRIACSYPFSQNFGVILKVEDFSRKDQLYLGIKYNF